MQKGEMIIMNVSGLKMVDFDEKLLPSAVKPVVFVEGEFYDMGVQYGMQVKKLIERNAAMVLAAALQSYDSREQLLKTIEKYYNFVLQKAPEIVAMWKGISEGSGVPLEQIVMLNGKIPVVLGAMGNMCSAISVWGKGTKDGTTMAAGNADSRTDMGYYGVILVVRPSQGNSMLANVDFAGQVCCGAGLNDKGVMGIMTGGEMGRPEDVQFGYDPMGGIFRTLLHAKSADEAMETNKTLEVFASHIALFVDKEGGSRVFEHTSDVEDSRTSGDLGETDYLIITNHFNCKSMLPAKEPEGTNGDSYIRYDAEEQMIKSHFGTIDIDCIFDIMGSNDYWTGEEWIMDYAPEDGMSINTFNTPNMRGIENKTLSTCAGIVQTGQMFLRTGCEDRYVSYMPDFMNDYVEIKLEETPGETFNYIEHVCRRIMWENGRKVELSKGNKELAKQYLIDSRKKFWEAKNMEIKGCACEEANERLSHFSRAATLMLEAQMMAKVSFKSIS